MFVQDRLCLLNSCQVCTPKHIEGHKIVCQYVQCHHYFLTDKKVTYLTIINQVHTFLRSISNHIQFFIELQIEDAKNKKRFHIKTLLKKERILITYCMKIFKTISVYSQTCIKRPLKREYKSGRLLQVVFYTKAVAYYRWSFNTGSNI